MVADESTRDDEEGKDEGGDDDDKSSGAPSSKKGKWFDVAKATTAAVRAWIVKYNTTVTTFESHVQALETLLAKSGGEAVRAKSKR